jgi:16S rRNA C967 or C1407 C5-methylase (RsmB/RsmF family)
MSDDTFSASDFESEASASSEPAATSTPAESSAPADAAAQPGAATTQPAATTTDQHQHRTDQTRGPIPFDVHKTALDNARSKAVEEWKQKYGWAEQVNQADLQEAIRIAQLSTPTRSPTRRP